MKIHPVALSDLERYAAPLSELGAATFADSFGYLYSAKDMAFFIEKNHSEAAYRKALRDPDQYIWVAEDGQGLAGYLTLCPNGLPCDPPVESAIELSKIYLNSAYQGQGIGQMLLDAAVAMAKTAGFENMVLSVWSENFAGHRFYQRNGFEKIGEYQFPVGEQLDDEWIMRKPL